MYTKKYSNPPIVEAICAFQFVPGAPWDATVLGLTYERLKADFPLKQQAPGLQFSFTIGAVPPANTERMQFRRADQSALVQIGPNTLTVNHLTPYCGWVQFRAMIVQALDAYRAVAAPSRLQGIGLRYINRLQIPAAVADAGDGTVEVEQYVRTHPVVPAGIPRMFMEWAQRAVIPFQTEQQELVLQSGTAPGSTTFPYVFVLDLEARPGAGQAVALADAMAWLEGAHKNVGTVFEECLGPRARALFGEETRVELG